MPSRKARWVKIACWGAALAALGGCNQPASVEGLVLPTGDAEQGQQVFAEYRCFNCHEISGLEMPAREFEPPLVLAIGVRQHRVRNYGELLTAIANPEHTQSPKFVAAVKAAGKESEFVDMPDFTDQMTVREFVDLAAFLDEQYSRLQPNSYKGQ